MRITIILSLLLFLLVGCGTKNAEVVEKPVPQTEDIVVDEVIGFDPVGTIVLLDGSTVELTKFKKLGAFLFHISGKLNGRSSTLIQFTRRDDLHTLKGISFENPTTITIHSRKNKEFRITDARVFIGSESEETFTFLKAKVGSLETEEITLPKSEVKLISFNHPDAKK